MIKLKTVMTLDNPFIAAASGLILINSKFMIIADDENFVAVYDEDKKSGISRPIFKGKLPEEIGQRKKSKPDIECLLKLSPELVMVIPSGSAANREKGVMLDGMGNKLTDISFHSFYSEVRKTFSELNIEGACLVNQEVWFFQRGNGSFGQNGIIKTSLSSCLTGNPVVSNIQSVDLGKMHQVPLSFTDATTWGEHVIFIAVAENSNSTYLDGEVVGSVLGLMNKKSEILRIEPLEISSKPEGLCTRGDEFFLVVDDDDRSKPSKLYSGLIPTNWKNF